MNELQARDIMQATILAGLPVPASRIAWQGLHFDPPLLLSWIRVDIQHDPSRQLSFGTPGLTRTFRRTGGLIVQCFAPAKGASMDEVVQLAINVKNLFEGNTISTIRFFDAGFREVPPLDATWLQANVNITFQYDELK